MSPVRPDALTERWSLTATVRDLRDGRARPQDLLDRAAARIAACEHRIHAWVRLRPDAELRSATGAGPLRGVPIGVKDIIDVAGLPTECGSDLRRGAAPATTDAHVVALLRACGAVPLGKTVSTEFAYFAPGPTRNPAAPAHTPGGSSSGSAAAVAAGMVPLAIGSQTAGSLTRPAAFCGVAGLVVTRGSLSTTGVVGLSPSLDSLGLLAAGVSDLRTAWAAVRADDRALAAALSGDHTVAPRSLRILVWEPAGLGELDPAMPAALDRAASRLAAAGATVTRLAATRLPAALATDHASIMAFEAARERQAELAHLDRLSEPLADLLRQGAQMPDDVYRAAVHRVAQAGPAVAALVDGHDAVLGPAALGPAPEGIAATGSPILSRPWQVLGLPVVTVPGLRSPQGLPLGLQLVGRPNGEDHLLAVAEAVEHLIAD